MEMKCFLCKEISVFLFAIISLICITGSHMSSKLIIRWTPYWEKSWDNSVKEYDCQTCKCRVTFDRSYLDSSDAVAFFWWKVNANDLPKSHKSGQKWVLINDESAQRSKYRGDVHPLLKDIDWFMSYRKGSDIYEPYGSVYKCDRKWNNENMFDKKTKFAAWVVSNCYANETPSGRWELAQSLAKYIELDTYGKCGIDCPRKPDCFDATIVPKYKFYLAFENSLCKDYITEKFFRTLEYDIIPVVYGGASVNDYKCNPSKSYINVEDYMDINDLSTAIKLADYLKVVSKDKQLYNSYFKWKSRHCSRRNRFHYMCNICRKLNESPKNETTLRQNLESKGSTLLEWWEDCRSPNSTRLDTPFDSSTCINFTLDTTPGNRSAHLLNPIQFYSMIFAFYTVLISFFINIS